MILIWLLVINVYGFLVMGFDKKLARDGKNRFSEKHLLTIAVIGGGVGIYLGMKLFRHKTKNFKFSLGVPLLILVNFVIYYVVIGNIMV